MIAKPAKIEFTTRALDDLKRLRTFLATKSEPAATRAKSAIIGSLKALPLSPETNRPVPGQLFCYDLLIPFGASGYIARYRYQKGGTIFVLSIRHQLEAGWDKAHMV